MKKLLYFFPLFSFGAKDDKIELIPNYNYGVLPTNVDLNMLSTDYTFTMAMLAIVCGFVFWLGWNSHT